ncbi:MAG: EFR1 family ferrodoxin [Clostridiales Family XIII bacterium]|jgi:ferredoxin|nr:EFR1 family ferrodoxin [Clostridiales Family XIII bacterium]
MKHIVFYFSGTGNCLKAAKSLAEVLPDFGLYSMGNAEAPAIGADVESVGFVYPTYFWGMPAAVLRFAKLLRPEELRGKYLYAIATYGGSPVNALRGFAALMKRRGMPLAYGATLKMHSNYVLMYDMKQDVAGATAAADAALRPILSDIAARRENKIGHSLFLANIVNGNFIKSAPGKDRGYRVSGACTGCGICEQVCPVANIRMENGRPVYAHHCEACVACIQYCPVRAIDFKGATQNRGRYHHPDIGPAELAKANKAML